MTVPWYAIQNAAEIASPALVVYVDRVRENLRRMVAMAGGVERLRPHVKTHKMAEVVRLQIDAGIAKFKCATIAEAEMLARAGAPDVLLAYPVVGPNIARLAQLSAAFPSTKFSALADDVQTIRALSRQFASSPRPIEVLVDLDVGMHRSGVAPSQAAERYRLLADLPGISPGGLHVYDGHVRDADPGERARHTTADVAPPPPPPPLKPRRPSRRSMRCAVSCVTPGCRCRASSRAARRRFPFMRDMTTASVVPAPVCFGTSAMPRSFPTSTFSTPQCC
jgi:D-threonine aldolase